MFCCTCARAHFSLLIVQLVKKLGSTINSLFFRFFVPVSQYNIYPRYPRKYFTQIYRAFVWRRHAGAHPDELQHGGRKPTETSVTEFCYKSVNLLLEELINIKVILFLILELFRQQNSSKKVTFLTKMTALIHLYSAINTNYS